MRPISISLNHYRQLVPSSLRAAESIWWQRSHGQIVKMYPMLLVRQLGSSVETLSLSRLRYSIYLTTTESQRVSPSLSFSLQLFKSI